MEAVLNHVTKPNEYENDEEAYFKELHRLMNGCITEYNNFATELTELNTITDIAKNKDVPNASYYCERILELKTCLPKYKIFLDRCRSFCNNADRNVEDIIDILKYGSNIYYKQ